MTLYDFGLDWIHRWPEHQPSGISQDRLQHGNHVPMRWLSTRGCQYHRESNIVKKHQGNPCKMQRSATWETSFLSPFCSRPELHGTFWVSDWGVHLAPYEHVLESCRAPGASGCPKQFRRDDLFEAMGCLKCLHILMDTCLANWHSHGKSPGKLGTSTINGHFQ